MALAVLSNEITRLEAALSSAPVHIARPMAARLAEARTAILLVCRGDFKIIDAAVRGDIMVAHTMPNLHNAAAPKFAQQITSAEIETAPTGKLTV